MLLHWLDSTKKFVKSHPEIMFTKADKGNATVAIGKIDYYKKMEKLLSEETTYDRMKKDPTKKMTSDLRALLVMWKKNDFIEGHTYRKLLSTDRVLPRAYGLPKIHKIGNPLRIIISSFNSPLYYLACYLLRRRG